MPEPAAAFYFDLASPLAYLAAERILHTMPIACEWQPVLASQLAGAESFEAFRCRAEQEIFRSEVQRRAAELGLQELRWPEPFPFDSAFAMRAATYAKSIGRVVAFAQAAFRQAFAGGRALHEIDNVLIAAAACEMHPSAVSSGAALRSVGEQLSRATSTAASLGVLDVPAVWVRSAPNERTSRTSQAERGRVFHGERALEQAGAYALEHSAELLTSAELATSAEPAASAELATPENAR